ncbi:hypothetical protein V1477_003155 [Vespula maculifrons]|uniref:Uncharacterized protein n=1 Tax=Vespula maculifrons TaxID=7453 RepID=A0ABD2CTR3_VESMC
MQRSLAYSLHETTRFLKMFVLLAFQDMKVFRACDKEYDPNRIHFRLRSLKPRRSASTIKQASRVRIVGPRPGQISGWGPLLSIISKVGNKVYSLLCGLVCFSSVYKRSIFSNTR